MVQTYISLNLYGFNLLLCGQITIQLLYYELWNFVSFVTKLVESVSMKPLKPKSKLYAIVGSLNSYKVKQCLPNANVVLLPLTCMLFH